MLLTLILSKPWSEEPQDIALPTSLPQAPAPDADSPADTIKTLTATVSSLRNDVELLRRENESLHKDREELVGRTKLVEERIVARLQAELLDQDQVDRQISNELTELATQVSSLSRAMESSPNNSIGNASYPGVPGSRELVWIGPLDPQDPSESAQGHLSQDVPTYTIPQNATLVDSISMTALIGRVPVDNKVLDPMPFKVVTGVDNLAANGLKVDGLEGSIWSGFAIGDWTLSCVSGTLTSVTFVFSDGRIRTIGENRYGDSGIAWISDDKGVPCIQGERKTNVRSWLIAQMASGGVTAAADAAASAETSWQLSPIGLREGLVSGDIGKYVLGRTFSGSGEALSTWLTERASQEFDAVFVATGQSVAIHVDRPIHIDYEQDGRRLSYEENQEDRTLLALD